MSIATTDSTNKNPITEGVIWRQILIFFFPIMIGTLFQQLYNTVDTIIVGRFVGKEALASIGGNGTVITNLIIGFFTGLSSGATVILAQAYGAHDTDSIHKSLHTAYALSIMAGIGLSIIGYFMTPWLLSLMNTPVDIMSDSVTYLRIYFLGLIATLIYNMGSAVMRAIGDSKRPLYYLIICSVLNIILDLLFVLVFNLGIAGAAHATVIAQTVSAILVTYSLMKQYDDIQLIPAKIRFHGAMLKKEIRIGLPSAIQSCIYSISNIIIQAAINGLGTDTAAAWGAGWKLDAIFWTTMSSFGIAMSTFAGQNFGAGKKERVLRSIRVCMLMSVGICGLIQAVLILFARPLYGIFTTDAIVIDIGIYFFQRLVPFYTLAVINEILTCALRGIGDVLYPTLVALGGIGLVRLPWILILSPIYNNIDVPLSSYIVSWTITLALLLPYYLSRKKKVLKTNS